MFCVSQENSPRGVCFRAASRDYLNQGIKWADSDTECGNRNRNALIATHFCLQMLQNVAGRAWQPDAGSQTHPLRLVSPVELSGAKEMGTRPTSLAPILGEFAWFWARTHRRDSCVLARGVRTSRARLLHAGIRVFGKYGATIPDSCKHPSEFLVPN